MIKSILICLLYTIVSLHISSEETKSIPKKKTKITWNKIKDATNYKIEIMDSSGEVKISEDTGMITFKEVILAGGLYKKRLIVTNKIGEEIVGKWYPLKIKAPTKNEIVKEEETTPIGKPEILPIEKPKIIAEEKPKPILEDKIYEKPKTRFDVLGRSMLLPGLGQYYYGTKLTNENFQKRRGIFYMGLFGFSVGLGVYALLQYQTEKSEFQKDTQNRILFTALIPRESNLRNPSVLYNLNETSLRNADLDSSRENFNKALGFMSLIYIVQLVDSIYLQNKIGRIRNILPSLEIDIRRQATNTNVIEDHYKIGFSKEF